MKTRWIKTTGLIALALMFNMGLFAQQGRGLGPCGAGEGPGNGRAEFRSERPFAGLDLSEEQQEELKTLRLAHYKEMKPLQNEMAELRLKKRNLMSEDEVDLKAVNKIIDQQSTLSAKMSKIRAGHQVEMRKSLTEEQRMLLDSRRLHARAVKGRDGYGRDGYGRDGYGRRNQGRFN